MADKGVYINQFIANIPSVAAPPPAAIVTSSSNWYLLHDFTGGNETKKIRDKDILRHRAPSKFR